MNRAMNHPGLRYYLASGVAFDDEMSRRIARHRNERGVDFETIEESLELQSALAKVPEQATALVDCATIWLSNMMLNGSDDFDILAKVDSFCKIATARPGLTIVVTNEVGTGIVPENALARRFRDLAGFANQSLAEAASEVYYCVFGIATAIKPSAFN